MLLPGWNVINWSGEAGLPKYQLVEVSGLFDAGADDAEFYPAGMGE